MTSLFSQNVGKAKLSLEISGCVDCNTIGSSEWHPAKKVDVQISESKTAITLYRCKECFEKSGGKEMLL